MSPEMLNWCNTQAYFLRHGTSEEAREARNGTFFDLCLVALRRIARDHSKDSMLHRVYDDLQAAFFIASAAMPITMQSRTFGEWVRFYERMVMPTWSLPNEKRHGDK
jgi:hypothetical protein